MVTKGKVGEMNQEYGVHTCIRLYIEQITNKDPLYCTGNYIQYLIKTGMEKNLKRYHWTNVTL